jgi:putative transposase
MTALFHQLLLTVASTGQRELARQVQYLKAEIEVLRGKLPGRVTVTPAERTRLIRYAKAVGSAIHQLATIVSPATVLRRIREEKRDRGKAQVPKKRGRRRLPDKVRRLVVKLARRTTGGIPESSGS